MELEVTDSENSSKGEKLKVPCKMCQNNTWHEVVYSINRVVTEGEDDRIWSASTSIYQIIKCFGCDDISFRSQYTNDSMTGVDTYTGEEYQWSDIELYPSRVVGRNGLDFLHILPFMIQNIYRETHKAICSKQPILAGIGIRALVESICKEKESAGNDLKHRIDDLVQKGFLSKNGSEILHHVRALGNDAAHEVKPHDEHTLGMAMDVVENLLESVYKFSRIATKNDAAKDDDLPF